MRNSKAILITNIISPYRVPLFNIISEKDDFDFEVAVLAEREKNREWQILKEKIRFNYQVLFGWYWFIWNKRREVAVHLNRGIFKSFLEHKLGIVIISGYDL